MEKGIRYEVFEDAKILEMLKEKKEIVKAGRELSEKTEKELEKKNQKLQKIKDKVKPMIDAAIESMSLTEFEVPTEATIEDGKIKIQLVDQVESYISLLRKKKEDGK